MRRGHTSSQYNYLPKASSLAASIQETLGIDAELIVGARGAFDVVADGELIFSKGTEHRFPEPDEVIGALRALAPTSS